jgi:hypothetical protein
MFFSQKVGVTKTLQRRIRRLVVLSAKPALTGTPQKACGASRLPLGRYQVIGFAFR